jgi:hypothetical protein
VGRSARRRRRGFAALFLHILTLTSIYTKLIEIQSSVIGYISKSVTLIGKGERHKGYRACDIAFVRFYSSHVTFLLLVKVCILRTRFPLSCSFPLGYRGIYSRRAPRCDLKCRRPCRYGPPELNLLCSSGTYTRSTTRRMSLLTFPAVYVSSSGKLAHGAQRIRGCNTIVRACTGSNAILWGRTGSLISNLPMGVLQHIEIDHRLR